MLQSSRCPAAAAAAAAAPTAAAAAAAAAGGATVLQGLFDDNPAMPSEFCCSHRCRDEGLLNCWFAAGEAAAAAAAARLAAAASSMEYC